MNRIAATRVAVFLLGAVLSGSALPLSPESSSPSYYTDLTPAFLQFFDETVGMEEQARVALLRERMDALLPGFYRLRLENELAEYDARLDRGLKDFPAQRPRFEQVQKEFAASFEAGMQHFRKDFPDFTPELPIYLVHSFGEMDGGTRTLEGRTVMVFGADVIARIHDAGTLTPFLDHELFHIEHRRHFANCDQVWCALWSEGLATYAASVMNPGADDRQLLLTQPQPIRAAVDANWAAALCFTRVRLDSTSQGDYRAMFLGGKDAGEFPRRFGYYMGLRVVQALDGEYSLQELARMPQERARAVVDKSMDRLVKKAGGCS